MIKDITIGQYFPAKSVVHRFDPRFKIIFTTLYIMGIFSASNIYGLLIGILFMAFAVSISKIPVMMIIKSIKPIIPLFIFTSIINIFWMKSGESLVKFWIFDITTGAISFTVFMLVRIICLVIGTSLLTYTTSPIALTDAIEYLLAPLKKVKFPVHELAMMMTIALRFIPTLIEETDKIMSAQKARGADIETGGIAKRVKALIPILIPLFVSAFRRAEDLALAMECRCYRGGEGRTRLKALKSSARDYIGLMVCIIFVAVIFLARAYL